MARANEVIAQFGGQSALARALGLNQSTVQHWAKTGQIPSWRLDQVQRAAQDLGIVLPGGVTAVGGRLLSSAPPSMSATRMGMQAGARGGARGETPAEMARRMLAGRDAARGAVQAPPNPPAGQMGVPHGRADFTPNVEWEIGALRFYDPDLFPQQARQDGPRLLIPEGPGLGVEVNEEAATKEEFQISGRGWHLRKRDGSITNS